MSYQNNLHYFNIAIEDYSISELYNLLELDEFTRENILLKVHDLTSNIFKNNEPIKQFFFEAQNKLLNHLSNNNTHNNILDNFLHANANSNIEVNQNYINNIAYEDEDDEDDEDDIEDNNTNYANDNVYIKDTNTNANANTNANVNANTNANANAETIETNGNIKESYVDYSKYKPIETDSGAIIETYDVYKNLYFNTFFRSDNSVLNSIPTDCKMQLTNSLNNVTQCKLTAINIKKPFLIHTSKANNTFIIKK